MKTSKFIEKTIDRPTAVNHNTITTPKSVVLSSANSKAPSQSRENAAAANSSKKSSYPVSPKVDASIGGTERRKFVASTRDSRIGR